MEIRINRIDVQNEETVELKLDESEELKLGRGPLLKIDATSISRHKISLKLKDGNIMIKCLKNPPIVIDHDSTNGNEEIVAASDIDYKVVSGDIIKFDPQNFFFKFTFDDLTSTASPNNSCDNSNDKLLSKIDSVPDLKDDINATDPKELHSRNSNNDKVVEKQNEKEEYVYLQSTSKKRIFDDTQDADSLEKQKASPVKKARKLPAWMLEAGKENVLEDTKVQTCKREPKDAKGKIKKSPMKSTEKNKIPELKSKEKDNSTCKNESTNDLNENIKSSDAIKTNEEEDGYLTKTVGDVIENSSLKIDGDSSPSGFVFPVLIKPEDLQDSDEESPVKKKKQPEVKKKKESVRPKCPFGEECYRKNPVHFQQESHPGDDDYADGGEKVEEEGGQQDDRPECEYGVDCYRKNPEHKRDFKHSHRPQPKRKAKKKAAKKKATVDDDEYESDFIDDDDFEEDVDDTDDDENWTPPQSDED